MSKSLNLESFIISSTKVGVNGVKLSPKPLKQPSIKCFFSPNRTHPSATIIGDSSFFSFLSNSYSSTGAASVAVSPPPPHATTAKKKQEAINR